MGEASNPGPSRDRSPSDILCRLETVLTRLDSSDEEPLVRFTSGRNVARRVSGTDHSIPPSPGVHARRPSRRVVLAPQSQLVQDHSSNRFAVLESTNQEGALGHVDSETVPASPNALHEAGVFGPSTTLLDELEDDLTRVDDDEVLGGRTESLLRASPHVLNMAEVASFAQPTFFADPVRDDESDNEAFIPQACRVPDQAQSGRHTRSVVPRIAPPRATAHPSRLVVFSGGTPVVHRVESQVSEAILATVQDTEPVHHAIGTPVDSDHESDIDDDTVSLVVGPGGKDPVWNEFESMFSEVPESVAGEGVVPQEEDPVPVEDITPGRVLREALESLDGVDVSALIDEKVHQNSCEGHSDLSSDLLWRRPTRLAGRMTSDGNAERGNCSF